MDGKMKFNKVWAWPVFLGLFIGVVIFGLIQLGSEKITDSLEEMGNKIGQIIDS